MFPIIQYRELLVMFGERLAKARAEKGLSQYQAAEQLGFSRGQLANYEQGTREPDYETLTLLADYFNVSIDYLLGRTNVKRPSDQPIMRKVPILGQIRAGIPLLNPDNYAGKLDIPSDVEADFAVQVVGDSMIGVGILEGDYAICREAQVAHPGQVVAALHDVAIGISEATLKYFFIENDRTILRAANPDYEDILMDGNYRIAGIMVALCRKEAPLYRVYTDYISVRDYTLEDWNEVIQLGIQSGLGPEQVKALILAMRQIKG